MKIKSINTFFIHIPRTGGTSVNKAIINSGLINGVDEPITYPTLNLEAMYGHLYLNGQFVELDHCTVEHAKTFLCSEDEIEKFQFVAFVRDPVERAVSVYKRAKAKNDFRALKTRQIDNFTDFVDGLSALQTDGHFDIKKRLTGAHEQISHYLPQFNFLTDSRGKLAVDGVYDLSELSCVWKQIFGKYNLPFQGLENANKSDPKIIVTDEDIEKNRNRLRHIYSKDYELQPIIDRQTDKPAITPISLEQKYNQKKICHFSFHKNLTVYYKKVVEAFCAETGRSYQHFKSFKEEFNAAQNFDIKSVNNHFINPVEFLDLSPDTRLSLFVRDPRDLVVSGYFYHKKGVEWWCNIKTPNEDTLRTVNMSVPANFLRRGETIAECLNRLPLEQGLKMEIEMRHPHFTSLSKWADLMPSNQLIKIIKYEDIVNNEEAAFCELASHYEFSEHEKNIWLEAAHRNSAKNVRISHIRNAKPQQWKQYLSDEHLSWFRNNLYHTMRAFDYL
ncbi:MAG: hypothetical protein VW124_09920 [Paracoccaceae bacterium]